MSWFGKKPAVVLPERFKVNDETALHNAMKNIESIESAMFDGSRDNIPRYIRDLLTCTPFGIVVQAVNMTYSSTPWSAHNDKRDAELRDRICRGFSHIAPREVDPMYNPFNAMVANAIKRNQVLHLLNDHHIPQFLECINDVHARSAVIAQATAALKTRAR